MTGGLGDGFYNEHRFIWAMGRIKLIYINDAATVIGASTAIYFLSVSTIM